MTEARHSSWPHSLLDDRLSFKAQGHKRIFFSRSVPEGFQGLAQLRFPRYWPLRASLLRPDYRIRELECPRKTLCSATPSGWHLDCSGRSLFVRERAVARKRAASYG